MSWAGHVARMGGEKSRIQGFDGETEGKRPFEDPGLDGRIILRWIFRKWDVLGMDWVDVAQDRDRWRAFVNVILNLRVP